MNGYDSGPSHSSTNKRDLSPNSYNKKFATLKPDNYGKKSTKGNPVNGRTFSNLDDYRTNVISTI